MADHIEFVRNYSDLSNDRGYQFEFNCDHCGRGYRTRFKPSVTGTVSGVLDAASSLLGGFLGSAANLGDRVHDAGWERGREQAYEAAVREIASEFVQCPRCQSWVCRERCWNTKRGLCKECAPDLGVEMSAAQASRSVEEIWAHAAMAEEDKKLETAQWRETIRATCPECEAPLTTNAKFCPECGAKLAAVQFCVECGSEISKGAKFCPECGTRQGA